ncbi:glutathione S-transferase domain protein [Burkholderia thailandensis]|uniref:Glutathione S-transferase domain protein n=1 Tax=Burkholderia thailandensis TaxID=57975 RepID=A0AAW9CW31_BURTH|nr:glutathione S-transferase domain protein [Burkholderia thailandensis]
MRDCDILLRLSPGARRASAEAALEREFDGSARARRYNRDLAAVAPHHGRPARLSGNFDAAMMLRSGR